MIAGLPADEFIASWAFGTLLGIIWCMTRKGKK